ncbi:MAG: hypothetical protein ACRD3G_12195 [Vicinamibacterales bacterium]
MRLRILIDMDNDAFHPEPGPEIARILRQLADAADRELITNNAGQVCVLRDVNGNHCGDVKVLRP